MKRPAIEQVDRKLERIINKTIKRMRKQRLCVHDANVEAIARRIAANLAICDFCGSADLHGSAAQGTWKVKPMVCCNNCGGLLAFG